VLRQTLLSSLGAGNSSAPPATVAQPPVPQQPVSPQSSVLPPQPAAAPETPSVTDAASSPHTATPTSGPSLSPEIDVHEILLPQARVPVAEEPLQASGSTARIVLPPTLLNAAPRSATAGAVLNLLQEALQAIPRDVGKASPATPLQAGRIDDVTVHTNTPPPPFRGALPATQPVALPSIASDGPLATSVRHLLDNTEAALARQTLLQVASLPDAVDTTKGRIDPTAPQWNFEIPFVTPQGTAGDAVRNFARRRRQRDRGGKASVAGPLFDRPRTGRSHPRADLAQRRADIGADVGGAAGDGGAFARRHRTAQ